MAGTELRRHGMVGTSYKGNRGSRAWLDPVTKGGGRWQGGKFSFNIGFRGNAE